MIKRCYTLFLFTIALNCILFAQALKFKHLTVDDGLSQNTVYFIAQDSLGFIWLGTGDGLNRYDGINFKTFRNDVADSTTISSNSIKTLCVDNNNILWVGTRGGGLNYYNPVSGKFFRYNSNNPNGIRSQYIIALCLDKEKNLWVGTADSGIYVINTATKKVISRFVQGKDSEYSLLTNQIRAFSCAPDGKMWIGTWDSGISVYDPKTKKLNHYTTSNSGLQHNVVRTIEVAADGKIWIGTWNMGVIVFNPKDNSFINSRYGENKISSIKAAMIWDILMDEKNNVWIATAEEGLLQYNTETNETIKCANDKNDIYSMSDNNVFSLFRDKSNQIWAGTWAGGINIYSPLSGRFNHFYSSVANPNSLSKNAVWCSYILKNGNVLFGHTAGVDEYNPQTKKFTPLPHSPDKTKGLPDNGIVTSIAEDADGIIWIVINGGGIRKYNPVTKKIEVLGIYECGDCLASNNINVLFADSKKNIWIGHAGSGINIYNWETKKFSYHPPVSGKKDSLQNGLISAFCEDKNGNIWIATGMGLSMYNAETKKFITYQHDKSNPKSLTSNLISEVYIDKNELLWVGTIGGGLNYFNPQKQEATAFTIKDGLISNTIVSMLEDEKSNLWITTNSGMTRFSTVTKEIRNFTQQDGLQSNEFNRAASVDANGNFYFGGVNGITFFNPANIISNKVVPNAAIIAFTALNKPYKLSNDISYTDEITLSYRDYFFSFEFSALEYTLPQKNKFLYKMDGFDNDWVEMGTRRFVTFTNLDPGEYTFLLKASNNDGIWNDTPTRIKIIITPPFWRTWWFYFLCAVSAILAVYSYIKWREKKLIAEKLILESAVEQRTMELKKEKEHVEEKQKEILDSIRYAKRIQNSLLPTEKYIERKIKQLKNND